MTARTAGGGRLLAAGVVAGVALASSPVLAQSPGPQTGTALSLFGGVTSGSSETGAAVGGAVIFDLDPRIALEAAGTWFDRGEGGEAFRIGADLLVTLTRPGGLAAPYVAGGVGVYRASIQTPVTSRVPRFYRDRIRDRMGGALDETRSFTDVVFGVGGGVRFAITRYVFLRPEARALVVRGEGDTHTLALIGVSLGFRIEERPVTP